MLVGTSDGVVELSRKDGAWAVERHDLRGARVEAVRRYDPPGNVCVYGNSILAATDQGVFRRNALPDAPNWEADLPGVDARSIAVTLDGTVFVGADEAKLYRRREAEEAFSEVAGFKELPTYATWTFPVSPHMPNIRSMAASPTHPGRVYVGVEVGGVMTTDDGGETWREARESIHPDIHQLAAVPEGGADHVFAVTGVGFYNSRDGAQSWRSRCDGLQTLYTIALANDPANPQRLVASATLGRPRNWSARPEGAVAKVYESRDGGERWEALMEGGLTEAVDALAIDDEGTVYAGTHGGQALALAAGASEWACIAEGLPPVNCFEA